MYNHTVKKWVKSFKNVHFLKMTTNHSRYVVLISVRSSGGVAQLLQKPHCTGSFVWGGHSKLDDQWHSSSAKIAFIEVPVCVLVFSPPAGTVLPDVASEDNSVGYIWLCRLWELICQQGLLMFYHIRPCRLMTSVSVYGVSVKWRCICKNINFSLGRSTKSINCRKDKLEGEAMSSGNIVNDSFYML